MENGPNEHVFPKKMGFIPLLCSFTKGYFFFSKAFLWEGFWDGGVLWVFQPPEAAIPIGFL